jgi:lipid-binding SYLF domain-containing protein
MYTYIISQGPFAGVSLEGAVIATRDEANAEYYGKPVNAKDILAGKVRPPAGARTLLTVLSNYSPDRVATSVSEADSRKRVDR